LSFLRFVSFLPNKNMDMFHDIFLASPVVG